jgi:hypothetical protein
MLKRAHSMLMDLENAASGSLVRRVYHYPRRVLGALSRSVSRDLFYEGSWYGNDTAWRMALDLNRKEHYASKEGKMQKTCTRRIHWPG